MSIVYHDISRADATGIQCVLQGNDTDTILTMNLSKFPWQIPFNGNAPSGIQAATGDDQFEVTDAVISQNPDGDVMLVVTLAPPPPADNTVGFNGTFLYSSL